MAVGIVVAVLAWLTHLRPAASFLVGWDVCVGLYLILAFEAMANSDVGRIRERAAEQDEGQIAILVGTVSAALASLAAILATFASPGPTGPGARVGPVAAGLAIFLSWAFIHTIFALHYAHEFYDQDGGGGMAFPGGGEEPDYWDFVYFSFVIGMTSQVSDVAASPPRRFAAPWRPTGWCRSRSTPRCWPCRSVWPGTLCSADVIGATGLAYNPAHEAQDPVAPARGAAGSADRDVSRAAARRS